MAEDQEELFCERLLGLIDEAERELGRESVTRHTLIAFATLAARHAGGANFGLRWRDMERLLDHWRRQGLN
jgi:hypothetical protein